ncbi:Serine/threonine-protein kinase pkn1 [Colletotrichum plurivorum]|uniref:Serine/threonine-protein kinase pkn1 n=1 Tax=Colletotrichum plurivorum TaxID=2175906 RepID=A0A8H6KRW0_9PEZI|nr:Serine/threonine-protein kinase pkn1 [Colletotrichum plurivorum]
MTTPMETIKSLTASAKAFGSEPLLALPDGAILDLARGYIPLLARFTLEDKAAKGLRKRKAGEKPETPVYFTALEIVRDNKVLVLTGGGKTKFAKHLSYRLATSGFRDGELVIRNEFGDAREERWDVDGVHPCYFLIDGFESLRSAVRDVVPGVLETEATGGFLVIVDGIENAGDDGVSLLLKLIEIVGNREGVRLLLLGETNYCERLFLPSGVARHSLLPLLQAQRRATVSKHMGLKPSLANVGTGQAAANPALFALALQAKHPGHQEEELVDAWLSSVAPEQTLQATLAEEAYEHIVGAGDFDSATRKQAQKFGPVLLCSAVQRLLAARHLASLPPKTAIDLFRSDPVTSQPVIRSCLTRLTAVGKSDDLVEGLITGPASQRGALLVADTLPPTSPFHPQISNIILEVVVGGSLSASERARAGRVLSRLDDPRDLTALAPVPAGVFAMGSDDHPNSKPVADVPVDAFRIGVYPVVNRDYLTFVRDTGRDWLSPDQDDAERRNAPATDVTWFDARAYCAWLTSRWRSSGRISKKEEVRLPTEAEWERAARGDEGLVFPRGVGWRDDAANSDEISLNDKCTVGMFPAGRSSYGCFDIAGNVWEWCSTLWGADMAEPAFRYPWQGDDGREDPDAPGDVRRVLRGGCFSSPAAKANCTYRGSLEPGGFWRGNGFRVVVASVPA